MIPELTSPTNLCGPDGRLDRRSVGWSRRALHRANLRGRGRAKRWEYWAVTDGAHVFAVTVSDLDYAALHSLYALDADGVETVRSALVPFARVGFAETCGLEPVRVRTRTLAIDLVPNTNGVHIRARASGIAADIEVTRPPGHESLAVVVPWSDRRFQYTVKENTLPARGTVHLDGRTMDFGLGAWATVDHGRGAWPYSVTWNWGAGSGVVDGDVVGVQVGGAWTDRTGSTENALCLNGRIHYIPDDLVWEYSPADWMAPWHIRDPRGGRVDLRFAPRHLRSDRTNLGILANDTHQVFGTWAGWMTSDDGARVRCDGISGWVEEVRNRW